MAITTDQKYTLMQRLFINAYTAFGQPTEGNPQLAAKAAGCKGKTNAVVAATASRWLNMVKIKATIDGINSHKQAMLAEKTGFNIERAQQMYEEDRAFAQRCKQSGAAVSATTGICRLYGMDKDAGGGEKTVIIISPKVVGPKQVESEVVDKT